jgi:alkanesulfonate monooxygenase SsuD/methylene tetrahydromethanopterin reductase-like flavin-dependent oxidoreductase (luciferase family)
MVGVNVFAADTDAEAQRLTTSLQQQFVSLRRNARTSAAASRQQPLTCQSCARRESDGGRLFFKPE